MIHASTEHFQRAFSVSDEAGQHFHVKLSCGVIVQAEMVVLTGDSVYLDELRTDRRLLLCKPGCEPCILHEVSSPTE